MSAEISGGSSLVRQTDKKRFSLAERRHVPWKRGDVMKQIVECAAVLMAIIPLLVEKHASSVSRTRGKTRLGMTP